MYYLWSICIFLITMHGVKNFQTGAMERWTCTEAMLWLLFLITPRKTIQKDTIIIHYLLPEGRLQPYFHELNVTGLNHQMLAVLWSVQCVYHTGTDSPLPGYNKDNTTISKFFKHLKYFNITVKACITILMILLNCWLYTYRK